MDADRFDRLARSLSVPRESLATAGTRRGVLGTLLGGALGLLGITRAAARRKTERPGRVQRERCLTIGEKCPKTLKHGKKTKRHSCATGCCTRYAAVGADGKRRCACRANGAPCTASTARQCCSQRCTGGVCGSAGPAGCTPTTCAAQGKNCGSIPDGCGGPALDCGTCPECQTCSGGTCTNVTDGASCNFTLFGQPAIGRCANGACTCVPNGESCNCGNIATVRGCCGLGCETAPGGTNCIEDGICFGPF